MDRSKQVKISHYDLLANQAIHLELPQEPYIVVLAIHNNNVTNDWRNQCSDWIVKSKQCYWALAWGHECSIWDDALDYSYLEFCNYDLPEDDDYNFMTTWHENQTLEDVIEFAESIPVDTLPQQTLYEIVVLNIY
ncbi:hypothetical protein M2R48_13495 [Acinetobacter sp. I-MWF]|uniref:DUF7684 family protein n=1 Tax=Acinetobacter TaxID=469 RepID=UPI0021C7B7FF|nr:hypothetical protein [Acinetobacter sp. I-MWF]MCT9979349.1 hypothetical protein [Acinetobacter sp. I-MWF]